MDSSLNAFPSRVAVFEGVSSAPDTALSDSVGCNRSGDFCGAGSLSRTCRITSDSRFDSQSRGEDSSMRAARIRANVFVFGFARR